MAERKSISELFTIPSGCKITCLESHRNIVYLGTDAGQLLRYKIESNGGEWKHALTHHVKTQAGKRIQALQLDEYYERLFVLTDGTVFMHDSNTMDLVLTFSDTKSATFIACNTTNGPNEHPHKLVIATSKKQLLLYSYSPTSYKSTRDISVGGALTSLGYVEWRIYCGFSRELTCINAWTSEAVTLDVTCSPAMLVAMGKEVCLRVGNNSKIIFPRKGINQSQAEDAKSTTESNNGRRGKDVHQLRFEVSWDTEPVGFGFHYPHLVGLQKRGIQVYNAYERATTGRYAIPWVAHASRCRHATDKLFFATTTSVYLLTIAPIRVQLKVLLTNMQMKSALDLIRRYPSSKPKTQQEREERFHVAAGLGYLMKGLRAEKAFVHFLQAPGLDVRELLVPFFPDLIAPSSPPYQSLDPTNVSVYPKTVTDQECRDFLEMYSLDDTLEYACTPRGQTLGPGADSFASTLRAASFTMNESPTELRNISLARRQHSWIGSDDTNSPRSTTTVPSSPMWKNAVNSSTTLSANTSYKSISQSNSVTSFGSLYSSRTPSATFSTTSNKTSAVESKPQVPWVKSSVSDPGMHSWHTPGILSESFPSFNSMHAGSDQQAKVNSLLINFLTTKRATAIDVDELAAIDFALLTLYLSEGMALELREFLRSQNYCPLNDCVELLKGIKCWQYLALLYLSHNDVTNGYGAIEKLFESFPTPTRISNCPHANTPDASKKQPKPKLTEIEMSQALEINLNEFFFSVESGDLKSIVSLIQSNPDIVATTRDTNGNTALHYAMCRHIATNVAQDIVCLLIDAGASINEPNHDSVTPLQLADPIMAGLMQSVADIRDTLNSVGATKEVTCDEAMNVTLTDCFPAAAIRTRNLMASKPVIIDAMLP